MSILLIDLSSLWYPAWHSTADQEVSAAFERTVGKVHSISGGYDHVAVCCDTPPYLRGELLPTYKAQRTSLAPQAIEQFTRTKERLAKDGFLLWSARGFEADDVIATAVRANVFQEPIVIASADKDLMVLVDDSRHTTLLSPTSGVLYDEAKAIEKYGVHPGQLADLLALWGDASDNIPGIPGVGPKTAAKLLLEFGTLEGVLTHADDIPQEKLANAIREHGNAARLARKVIELRTDVPIDVAEIFKERAPEKLATRSYDMGDSDLDEAMGRPEEKPESKPDALAKAEPPTQTIVTAPVSFDMALEPQSIAGAYKLAEGMFQSRLYGKFGNAEAIWAVIIRGREMGLGALTALDCFHVIEGKPALSAHLILARARQHPACEYFQFISGDAEHAEFLTKRRENPEPTRLRYTIEQAKRAGLVRGGGNWEKRPDEMLRKTAAVQLARIEYPEAALGLYAIEELDPEKES